MSASTSVRFLQPSAPHDVAACRIHTEPCFLAYLQRLVAASHPDDEILLLTGDTEAVV